MVSGVHLPLIAPTIGSDTGAAHADGADDRWTTPTTLKKFLLANFDRHDAEDAVDDAFDLITVNVKGYEGFGSFHSENVEVLVAQPDSEYAAPQWPNLPWVCGRHALEMPDVPYHPNAIIGASGVVWDVEGKQHRHQPPVAFGKPFLDEHFMISRDFVFINHGAFGGALRGAQVLKEHLDWYKESQILRFYDRELLPLLVYVVRTLSKFIGARPKNVVLVQNATSGLNSAIRHLVKAKDVVGYLDTEYLSVYKIAFIRCQEIGASLHEVPLNAFLHREDIVGDDQALTEHIIAHLPKGCSVFIIDYVTSTSAMMLPVFTHIVPALRAAGVKRVIVDGAHAPLQIHLDFLSLGSDSQPDAFVGNLHKWFSCPKAAAFMWIKDENLRTIEPAVLSHGAREGTLSSFIWDGTRDYNPYLTLPAIIHFWEAQGLDAVRQRCNTLLCDAVQMLTRAFGSRPVARHAPFMSLVELPAALQDRRDITAKYVQDVLHSQYKIEVPVKQIEGRLYFRISAFVYNEEAHYAFLRDAVQDIIERIRKRPREDGTPCPTQHVGGCGVTASQAKMSGF